MLPSSLVTGFANSGVPRCLRSARSAPAASPNDSVVRLERASDVQLVDRGVRDQVGADLGSAVDDAQEAARDQRRQRELEDRAQVGVDRAHLEQAHRAFDERLVDHVEHGDGGDVARAEHQHHAPLGIPPLVETSLNLGQLR